MRKLVLLALIVVFGCSHAASDVPTVEVRTDDLVIGVEVVGELEAVDSTQVKPPPIEDMWDFKIAQMAAEGDEVNEGDPILAFDGSEKMRDFENMRNEADAAQKALDKKRDDAALARRDDELHLAEAEAELRKAALKTAAPTDLVASIQQKETELDEQSAKLKLEAAKQHAAAAKRSDDEELQHLAQKATYAKHRVEELQQLLTKLQVTAPRAGTVVLLGNGDGEKHKVGDSVWRLEDIMQIVKLGNMVGAGEVDEVDIAKVDLNQPVTLRLDALPDVQLKGHIQDIAKSVQNKSRADASKVIHLKVAIDPTKEPLRPGMRFRGQIETEKLPGVVVVPADAVFVTPAGPVAYRESGGALEPVKLVLGKRNSSVIEVKSGLHPGDRVSRVAP